MPKDADDQIIDLGAMEELKERFSWLNENMEAHIFALQNAADYVDSAQTMFRVFHSIKALSTYLHLQPITDVAIVVEDILSILRHKQHPASQEIVDWMLVVSDTLAGWHLQIEHYNYQLDPIDLYTLHMVKAATVAHVRGHEILKKLRVLFIEDNPHKIAMIDQALQGKTADCLIEKSLDQALELMQKQELHIIGCSSALLPPSTTEAIKKVQKNFNMAVPVVILESSPLSKEDHTAYRKASIDDFFPHPISTDSFYGKMCSLAKTYYEPKSIKLTQSPLLSHIESIRPLQRTMEEVKEFMHKPDAPLRTLSSIITKDSILCAKILKRINSFGCEVKEEISSVHHAITLLGKEKIIALAFQSTFADNITIDLTPYGITPNDFYEIAYQRMNLMMHWYSKVSLPDLGTLTTVALLGNMGQAIIAEEILRRSQSSEFSSYLSQTSIGVAEMDFLHTITEDVTAEILHHWGLDSVLIDILRCSTDLSNTYDAIRPLAIAAYVVFYTLPSYNISSSSDKPLIENERVEQMSKLLQEMGLDPDVYQKAVSKVQKNHKNGSI